MFENNRLNKTLFARMTRFDIIVDITQQGGTVMLEKNEKRPLRSRTLFREEIRDRIIDAILSNELKPGERIVETRLAKELGVSQSPVREAIRELEMIGLVETRPFQGSYVREITLKDVMDSERVRLALEKLAIKDTVEIINDEQIEELKKILIEMEEAAKNKEIDLFVRNDVLFHKKIVEIPNNQTLFRLWDQCHIKDWTFIFTKLTYKDLDFLALRHEDIYNALKSRDKKKAVDSIINHHDGLVEMFKTAKNDGSSY
ncbi:DNA-binding transcriptional regulator, GntR family [Clostridium magnum DSM 2767]|nr:DNA-binding transcriptional regulator, GntR family [Clostridium magnum DSM 2767]